jgi:hypothetical protein
MEIFVSVSRQWSAAAAFALVAALSACQVTTGTFVNKKGYVDFFTYAAANRDFKFTVLGNPFPGRTARTAEATLAAFQRNYAKYNTRFTATPGATALPPYRIVVAYGHFALGAERAACAGTLTAPAAEAATLEALAVFCDDAPITFVRTSLAKPSGPDDPTFASALNQLAWQLIPETAQGISRRTF